MSVQWNAGNEHISNGMQEMSTLPNGMQEMSTLPNAMQEMSTLPRHTERMVIYSISKVTVPH